ncbi:MAG: Rpn family recombination-promoting nuclease/putative transposase [Chitinophagaceae bacterium]|nr:Rpn family recombination-promoting nuclease/putative transposase [Chitinophagaceae bacterium]
MSKNNLKNRVSLPPIQYDETWKLILSLWTKPAIEFFLPNIAQHINWDKKYRFIQQEFSKFKMQDSISRVDTLLEFELLSGKSFILLLHIEIQSTQPETIAKRMLNYLIRIYSEHPNKEIQSFILYIGQENYPNINIYQPFQMNNNLRFEGSYYMLAEHSEGELMSIKSPIAYCLLLNKWINTSKKTEIERLETLRKFVQLIKENNINREEIHHFLKIADNLVTLPKELKEEKNKIIYQNLLNNMITLNLDSEQLEGIKKSINIMYEKGKTVKDFLLEGKIEGEQVGIQKGKMEERIERITTALKRGKLTLVEIAEDFDVTLEFVMQIKKEKNL